ncbi:MAG: DUF5131 family protein [Candidatus Freyarchaeota archaeon]
MKRSRMFRFVAETWNPLVGCEFRCVYCWARRMAKRLRHKCNRCYYFVPHVHFERLRTRFKSRGVVFVCDMADIFSPSFQPMDIRPVLFKMAMNKKVTFLIETKNPSRYFEFLEELPRNVIISTTIETNRVYPKTVSRAPSTLERFKAFLGIPWERKHVSIEPIMDFDMSALTTMMARIEPETVSVGYDNYGVLRRLGIPQPEKKKYQRLVEELKSFTKVEDKTFGDGGGEHG